MAIDPSIALGFQMPQLMNPMQAQGQMMSLKALQQQAQLRNIEIQQGQQTLKDQQELSALAADRSNIDPETGGLTPEALTKLTNPMLRQKLNQDRMATKLKAKEIEWKTSEAGKLADERQSKALHDVFESAYAKYEDVLTKTGNKQAATEAFNKAQSEGYADLKTSGRGGFTKDTQLRLLTPEDVAAKLMSHKERMDEKAKSQTPFLKETEYLKELEGQLADLKPTDPAAGVLRAQIADVKKHIAKLDAPPKYMIGGGTGAAGSAGGAATAQKPLDDTAQFALDTQSWNYIKDGKLPYRKGTGGGADRNDAVVKNAARIAQALGLTPQELAAQPAEWKANAASMLAQTKKLDAIEGQLSSFHNNLETWDSLAKGLAPKLGGQRVKDLAKDLKKVDFTGIRSVDEVKMRIEQQFNDPTTSAVAVAAMAAAMDYARIMQGPQSAASLTEGARKEAERLISMAADEKGRKGIMAALESDTEGQVKGLRDQIGKTRSRLTGRAAKTDEPTNPAPAAAPKNSAPAAAVNHLKAHPELKDAFKAKYGYLPDGV